MTQARRCLEVFRHRSKPLHMRWKHPKCSSGNIRADQAVWRFRERLPSFLLRSILKGITKPIYSSAKKTLYSATMRDKSVIRSLKQSLLLPPCMCHEIPPQRLLVVLLMITSSFLHPMTNGVVSGEIDIVDVSRADWTVIGRNWSEQASQKALMYADKPSLELIQVCQILALYWFAKGKITRTDMHTSTHI